MTPQQLRNTLRRYNIMYTDGQFEELVKAIDADGNGAISWEEFLDHYSHKSDNHWSKQLTAKVQNVTVQQAAVMVTDKIQNHLPSGSKQPLRQAFQYFDRNGSGGIDKDELKAAISDLLMLEFDQEIIDGLYAMWDPQNKGEIDFLGFSENVLGQGGPASTLKGGPLAKKRKAEREARKRAKAAAAAAAARPRSSLSQRPISATGSAILSLSARGAPAITFAPSATSRSGGSAGSRKRFQAIP